ncbi:MAG TPA: M48 family metalloprotease [Myxococcota bacterium]|nr:M48 family metalloprotease [Myxococcota bacterium]
MPRSIEKLAPPRCARLRALAIMLLRGAIPRAFSIAIAAAFAGAACGGAPPTRERPREVILRSEDVDRRVGEETAQDVDAELGLIQDPTLVGYVAEVGARLARHAPSRRFDYTFQVVDQDLPNAFALPGGYIFVSRGLLALANTEDELANVLGHEIVHVYARHAAARQQVASSLPAKLDWLQGAYLARYGRDQESEADRLGQDLAATAGYDPNGLVVFLRELGHTERLRLGASRLPGFWDTHPSTNTRVAEAGARANMTAWKRGEAIAATREEYLRRIDGIATGVRAAEGVFIEDRFMHADLDLYVRFPQGWETANTHRAVGAISPRKDAQIFLEMQGPGTDLMRAAGEYVAELADSGFRLEGTRPLRIGELAALRAEGQFVSPAGSLTAVFTWLERGGSIYRFTAVAPANAFRLYTGVFLNVPRSFRALEPHERAQIQENRLRIAVARGGETLVELSARTDNRWDIQHTAVMNDVFADHVLEDGQLVKIAVAEDYQPEADAAPGE